MLDYNDFAAILGIREAIRIDEVHDDSDGALQAHTDLTMRLAAFPKEGWIASVWDAQWGILFIYRVGRRLLHGVIYRGVSARDAAILLQHASAWPQDATITYKWFAPGDKQIAITRMDYPRLYYVYRGTQIPFPFPLVIRPPDED